MKNLVVFALLLLSAVVPVFGQATDSNLVGVVVDASGAAVQGATIEIQNVATGVKYTTKSGADGQYRLNNIPIGQYNVTANAQGFAASTLKGVSLELNKTATANLTMQVGTVSTAVEISEAGVTIDTTTAQVGTSYDSRQIVNLPIIENANGLYGALQLSLLGSGVASNGGVGQGTGPSVGGQRPMNNNFMIEGVDNNNKTVTGPLAYVPTEATAEFTLLQNQFGAEFGHSTGGQFNTVIRSGENSIHGSVYEYFQNRNLNAIDAQFVNSGIRSQPRFDQNKLGASIGGPIKKDKLFYFGNFEYAPLGQAYTPPNPVFTPTAQGFALLDRMNNINKTNYSIFKQYVPAAPVQFVDKATCGGPCSTEVNGTNIPFGILPISGSAYTNFYTYLGSVDYNITDKDQIRGRIIFNKYDAIDNNAQLPTFWSTLPQRYWIATVSQYHTFSPGLTNELRLGYSRFSQFYTVGDFKFPGLDVFPNIQLDNDLGLQIGPNSNAPQWAVQNTYQLVENVNWTKGKHTLKFGFDGRNSISPQHFVQRERGDYDYDVLEEYLLDKVPSDLAERNLGQINYYGNQWSTYYYANDNWRVTRNLSVNLGVRYERTTVPLSQRDHALNALASVPGLITFKAPSTYNKGWAPRVGIAYSPGTSGRTSIRAGFGMAYDVIFDNVGSTAYPPQQSITYDAVNFPNVFKDGTFLTNGGISGRGLPPAGNLSVADARQASSSYIPDQIPPTSVQWNVGVQHVFKNDYTLEVRYLGSHGYHLLTQNRLNKVAKCTASLPCLPTYLSRPSQAELDALTLTLTQVQARPSFGAPWRAAGFDGANVVGFMPWSSSKYHGLATQLTRRFTHGLQAQAAYTWSHNMDNATATHFSTVLSPRRPQDFSDLKNEWSASPLDRRHRLTLSWLWETPWMKDSHNWAAKNLIGNWRVVGTYTAETGELVTPQAGTDSNGNGDSVDRTFVNPAGQANIGSGVTALRNTAGATVAYLANNPNARYIVSGAGTFPNAGRNTLRMPGINNWDMSLAKRLRITESKSFEIRGDAANLFNHAQYTAGYINSVRLTSNTNSRIFLIPSSPQFAQWSNNFSSNSRTMQLVAKFIF